MNRPRHIPDGWKLVKIKDVAEVNPHSFSVDDNTLVTFLPMNAVSTSGFIQDAEIRKAGEIKKGFTSFETGDILVAKITPCFENYKGCLCTELENDRGFGSTEFHVLRPKKYITAEYLYILTRTHHFRGKGVLNMTGSAGQKRVPSVYLVNYVIPLPPVPEQKAIAELLSTWDEAIEKIEKLIVMKKIRLNELYQYYFNPKQPQNILWTKVKIGKLLKPRNTKAIPSDDRPLFSLTMEDGITAKTDRYNREALVKDKSTKKYKVVCQNDFVFNPSNLRWGAIARSMVSHEVLISPIYEVLCVKNDTIDIDFLSHLLTCPRQIGIYAANTEGTLIERMAVKLDAFLLLDIYLPTKKTEQERIARILTTAQSEINLLKQLKFKYETQKQGLLQKLLSGEWRIKKEVVEQYAKE